MIRYVRGLHVFVIRHACLLALTFGPYAGTVHADPPSADDDRLIVELFAEHPQLVTPTGITVDRDGRVFVAESHTHFRPDDYDGPPADRILIFEDADGDGRADKRTIFHEGFTHVMDIELHRDGSLYVATRMDIHRMRDTDGDLKADQVTPIVTMDTSGTYPHNGISGLAFDGSGHFHFGLGENLGHDYTLTGSDGVKIGGGGEGGSTYYVRDDGSELQRVSTGWWNPFGMCVDRHGRVFGTDNDPGASPPCRLIQVVEGADYGYEYRYGRTGLHPLISWTGDLPGTIPMIAGTGEAPCAILSYDGNGLPDEYRDQLFVASWADHRIERYPLEQQDDRLLASTRRETFIEGPDDFRPVGLAIAPDGSVFISDWVSSSYTLHKQGRIWRISSDDPAAAPESSSSSDTDNTGADRLDGFRLADVDAPPDAIRARLRSEDPVVVHSAIQTLTSQFDRDGSAAGNWIATEPMATLLALKRSERRAEFAASALPPFLGHPDPVVRQVAVKWAADDRLTRYRKSIEAMLTHRDLDLQTFLMVSCALDRLDDKKPRDVPGSDRLLGRIIDAGTSNALRRLCLRLIDPTFRKLTIEHLKPLLESDDPGLRLEAVRTLAELSAPSRFERLAELAGDSNQSDTIRAEAVRGLAQQPAQHRDLLLQLAVSSSDVVRAEALRSVVGLELSGSEAASLNKSADTAPDAREAVDRLQPTKTFERPQADDVDAWLALLDEKGDAVAGERIFFGHTVGTCWKCHEVDGRGNAVGPSLTMMGRRLEQEGSNARRWLLQTILQPGRDMAPQYTPWTIVTKDGQTLIGLPRRKGGNSEAYLGLDGKEFIVNKQNIEFHREMTKSVMPDKLLDRLTVRELNDLFAFLMRDARLPEE